MKKANVNAIRTHFLGPRCLAELCDELGVYLLQELPIDWGTNYIHDPEWVGPALQRLEGGIRRDRHHPSVMVWSIGNENMPQDSRVAEDGWNHLRIYDRFAKTSTPPSDHVPAAGAGQQDQGYFRAARWGDCRHPLQLQPGPRIHEDRDHTNPRSWDADIERLTRGRL